MTSQELQERYAQLTREMEAAKYENVDYDLLEGPGSAYERGRKVQAISAERYTYAPFLFISFYEIVQILPCAIGDVGSGVKTGRITHATIHKRKDWFGGQECIVFHREGDHPKRKPFILIRNIRSELFRIRYPVAREDVERLGNNRLPEAEKVTDPHFTDERVATSSNPQIILYESSTVIETKIIA